MSTRPWLHLQEDREYDLSATTATYPWRRRLRYEPVTVDGRRLIDGALSAPVPVDAARALGAGFTIAIDVAFRPYEQPISGVAFQMFHIMVNRLIDEQIKRDEGGIPALIRAGEAAVYRRWPALQQTMRAAGIEVPHR